MPAIVEKAPKRELEERVNRMLAIVERVVHLLFVAVAQLVRHDRVEVGRVCGVADFRYVRRGLVSQASLKVHPVEEGVSLQLARAAFAQALVGGRAQPENQVSCLGR